MLLFLSIPTENNTKLKKLIILFLYCIIKYMCYHVGMKRGYGTMKKRKENKMQFKNIMLFFNGYTKLNKKAFDPFCTIIKVK